MHFRILKNDCHQWLSDSSRVTKFVFGRGSAQDLAEGVHSAPPDPLAGLRG